MPDHSPPRARATSRAHGRRPGAARRRDLVHVERDLTEPADQVLWGYAKNFRSRMGQHDRATSESELDAVVGGAIVVDPSVGIVEADIGIKDGRVVGIGKATPTSPTGSTSRSGPASPSRATA